MKKIFEEINRLSRKIQNGERTYYNGRIIEFLYDVLMLQSTVSCDRLIKWLDDSDKEYYTDLLLEAA